MRRFCLAMLVTGLAASTANAQTIIVDDDFESYADEAALHAVWRGNPESNQAAIEDSFDLTVQVPLNPDFNGDGNVDAADYVLWRKDPATHGGDPAGYDAWRAQFGGPPSGGGSANTYVFRELGAGDPPPPAVAGNLQYALPLDPGFPDGSIFPSQGLEPIVVRGDILTVGADGLGRNAIGLRSNSPANIWEMGVYNDGASNEPAPAGTTGAATHGIDPDGDGPLLPQSVAFARFGIRAQLFQNFNPNWLFFAMDPLWDEDANGLVTSFEAYSALGIVDTPAFHTLEATFEPVEGGASGEVLITTTLDLLADGMNNAQGVPGVDGTITIEGVTVSQAGFDSLRIGGPSQLSSSTANGFDNIFLSGPRVSMGAGSIAAVPEPTTGGLALLCTAGLFVARRRERA